MMMHLYIPESYRPQIIRRLDEIILSNWDPSCRYKKVRTVAKDIIVPLVEEASRDQNVFLERCISHVESCQYETITEFFISVKNRMMKHYDIERYNIDALKAVSSLVSTALAQSLITQFKDQNIFVCVDRLRKAANDFDDIKWAEVECSEFVERLKQNWLACIKLIESENSYNRCHSLLTDMGIISNEFIHLFFSPRLVQDSSENEHILLDVWYQIIGYLDGKALINFRHACKKTYNIVETYQRLKHRIHFIQHCKRLRKVIGKVFFVGNGFLVTHPRVPNRRYIRVIPLENPELAILFSANIDSHAKVIGCYALKNSDGNPFILVAVDHFLFNNEFDLKGYCLDKEKTPKVVEIPHPYMPHYYPDRPFPPHWKRKATITLAEKIVTVALHLEAWSKEGKPTGITKDYTHAIHLSEFD
jgi:hypothetical protein